MELWTLVEITNEAKLDPTMTKMISMAAAMKQIVSAMKDKDGSPMMESFEKEVAKAIPRILENMLGTPVVNMEMKDPKWAKLPGTDPESLDGTIGKIIEMLQDKVC